MYHHGNLVGFLSSVFLVPDSSTAIIAMSNSHPFADSSDWVGQLVLETVLEGESSHDFIRLTEDTKSAQFAAYSDLARKLDTMKTQSEPSRALGSYCGQYYNKAKNFRLDITVEGRKLRMNVQGLEDAEYMLEPYGVDTFWWPVNREYEQCEQCMFSWTWPGIHLISFHASQTDIDALDWDHGVTTPSAERFIKASAPEQV